MALPETPSAVREADDLSSNRPEPHIAAEKSKWRMSNRQFPCSGPMPDLACESVQPKTVVFYGYPENGLHTLYPTERNFKKTSAKQNMFLRNPPLAQSDEDPTENRGRLSSNARNYPTSKEKIVLFTTYHTNV